MPRILIAGNQHETNTFAPSLADWAAFTRGDSFPALVQGRAMQDQLAHGLAALGETAASVAPLKGRDEPRALRRSNTLFRGDRLARPAGRDCGHSGPRWHALSQSNGAACETRLMVRSTVAANLPGVEQMKVTCLIRKLVEWLAMGCFLLWCFFSYVTLVGTPRLPSRLTADDLVFLLWFAAAWWGWAALIWSEAALDDTHPYPRWVKAGLLAGMICVLIAFRVGGPKGLPTGSVSFEDVIAAAALLLLFGLAPVVLAIDHLYRMVLRI